MKLNPDNDVYTGDLSILNIRKQEWSKGDDRGSIYRYASYILLVIGLIVLIFISTKTYGGTTMMSQLPLHIAIWSIALIVFLVVRQGKKISERPFNSYHSARFEADDDTLYYVYQQGMSLYTYYIHDGDIRKIHRDDKSGVLLIKGAGTLNRQTRSGDTEEQVDEFYALVPFDRYDLDDLLKPYRSKVVSADGKLREQYIKEH